MARNNVANNANRNNYGIFLNLCLWGRKLFVYVCAAHPNNSPVFEVTISHMLWPHYGVSLHVYVVHSLQRLSWPLS